jgi:hypothetical protein
MKKGRVTEEGVACVVDFLRLRPQVIDHVEREFFLVVKVAPEADVIVIVRTQPETKGLAVVQSILHQYLLK